jgi:small subunit ribosomal protein S20
LRQRGYTDYNFALSSGTDMANTKGARKAARQSEKRRRHNASLNSELGTAIKSVAKAIQAGDKAAARKALSEASGVIDRIADKHIIHKNKAARHKSRLAQRLRAMA